MALRSNMSVISAKTGRTSLASILKTYSPTERDKAKILAINKVRFEMPKKKGLLEVVKSVEERENDVPMTEFVCFLNENPFHDGEFAAILKDARSVVQLLSPKFTPLVEALLSMKWNNRSAECIKAFSEFCLDLLVAHNKYLCFGIYKLVYQWIPTDDSAEWLNDQPNEKVANELQAVHDLLQRLLNAIPMAFDALLDAIEHLFPYYKKATHIIVGYVHNIIKLLEYKPIATEFLLQLLLQKLVVLDVNASRSEIEEMESDDEDENEDDEDTQFEMEDCEKRIKDLEPMKHPIANTLDICMFQLYKFLKSKNSPALNLTAVERQQHNFESLRFLNLLLKAFDNAILPIHNTHHAQFVIFYYCSLKETFTESFLSFLWDKLRNPNCSAVIRQASVGYIASFLARSKYIAIGTLKHYLKELCSWAGQYIQGSDQYRSNGSLKANLVFYSVCQAIFYVIAFRSRDLTQDKKGLLFLQSLHLSTLVTCNFNPLRVCLPAVATAFAGVTRAYQLAYCHTILERNARRKLATVYINETSTPEETLDTFFPFDPYLLKLSSSYILPIYLQYQASEAEEHSTNGATTATEGSIRNDATMKMRKRGDSEMMDDHDIDDFLLTDKRQKMASLARSQERESQFTYGLSPGFQM